MRFRDVIAAALTIFSISMSTPLTAADWPQWLGRDRNGKSSESGLFAPWKEAGPPLLYEARGIGGGYAAVSIVDDRIFTTGNVGSSQAVTALQAADGKILWQTPITAVLPAHDYAGSRSTPTYDRGKLYVVASSGAILCLNATDGEVLWRREFSDWGGKMMSGWGFSESPLIVDDAVICTPGGKDGIVVALDKEHGKDLWACRLPAPGNGERTLNEGAGYSSPMLSHGGGVPQIIQLVGRGLIGIRLEDGELLWRYDRVANTTANIPTPIIDGDLIFTSTAYGTGSALLRLEPAGRAQVSVHEVYWLEADQLQNKHGGMILVDGYIYCGTGNGQGLPICVEMASGKIAWGPERGQGRGEASLVYADHHLVIRRDNGTVMLVRATPEKFELVHSFMPVYQEGNSWAYPVIAGGRLYLREQDHLMVYDIAGGLGEGRGDSRKDEGDSE